MKVYQTGIRSGEYITSSSTGKQNRGSLFQVKGEYPPSAATLPEDAYDWSILLQQLETIPFFAELSFDKRKEWLLQNATPNPDLYLEDVPLQIRIVKLEGTFFREKLDQTIIDHLIQGNPNDPEGYWDLNYVYNLIPRKPGSRARRHTLIFRPGNWQIHNSPLEDQAKLRAHSGLVIDLNRSDYYSVVEEPVDYLIMLNGSFVGVRTGKGDQIDDEQLDILKWASPSVHKSLIQKIIRTGCSEITYQGQPYDADLILRSSFRMLLAHPGSFVPDIQRHVSGQESALKRLAVSICEDAYTENYRQIMCLFAAALVTQTNKSWRPTPQQVEIWIDLAIQGRKDRRYWIYSTEEPQLFPTETNEYTLSYLLLKELRSFKSDINMLGTIDGTFEEGPNLLSTIPLEHCIDHHNITDVGYHFPLGTCVPYPELFRMIWVHSSGINPRKEMNLTPDNTLRCIRYAQALTWEAKSTSPTLRPIIEGSTQIQYQLTDEWLAGMLGPISLKVGRIDVLVSLHPDDIHTMLPIKKPSRGDKDIPKLSSSEYTEAIRLAEQILSTGVPMKVIPGAMQLFKGAFLLLYQGEYILKLADGSFHRWQELKNTQRTFPHHPDMPPTLENSIRFTGDGISQHAEEQLNELLKTSPEVLRRLAMYLESSRSVISLFKISRDGTGQDYAVSPLDTEIFHILSGFTVIYPGALKKLNTREFKITYGPLIWKIRERLQPNLQMYGQTEWGEIYDRRQRSLWQHQEIGWQKMLGKRGHLIWIPVGMGKTLMVMRYFQELIQTNKMPVCVIYALPPSAIQNTIQEIRAFGFRVHLMDLRATGTHEEHTLKPFTINLVKHDHLRMDGDLFRSVIEKSFFVVDEFHLTLNKTIRTSTALELAKTSQDFIGLSGTIVHTDNVDDLIHWLQQIVDFEVTSENFWVAVSAMVSNQVATGVNVNHYSHEIQLQGGQKERYLSLVGGALGGNNPKPSPEDFREAVQICQAVCLIESVNVCLQYYNQGESMFMVAKDMKDQQEMRRLLLSMGIPSEEMILLGKDQSIAIMSGGVVRIAITTIRHSTGYTYTKARIMITSVYFSNQATREQLEGRINRIGQTSPEVFVITIHTGVLTHILQKYENARSLSATLKQLAGEI